MSNHHADLKRAVVLQQQGRLEQAEAILRKAIAARPGNAHAQHQLALLKAETGAFAEAHYLATAALEADPAFAPAYTLLGRVQLETGSPEAALESYARALAIAPQDAEALFGRGFAFRQLRRYTEALENYEAALALCPGKPELLCNYGNVLQDLGRYAEALDSFDRALRASPRVPLLHFNRGNALMKLGRHEEAVNAFDAAIRLDAKYADAWNNRGNALLELGRIEASLDSFGHAIALVPRFADALVNRGNALLELDLPRDAADAFSAAIAIEPGNASAYNGLGMAMQRSGSFAVAAGHFARALELDPAYLEAQHNRSLLNLFALDFSTAWPGYEARLGIASHRIDLRKDPRSVDLFERLPRWTGPGAAVAGVAGIWAEQGIGDQILFSTLLPELSETGQPFVYEVDRRLLPAYQRSFPAVQFVALTDPPSDILLGAAAALFAGSLPQFFRPTRESFVRQPRQLLTALPERVAHYAAALDGGIKVALSWRSLRAGWLGRSKGVKLEDMAPLFAVNGARWVDVQYGDTTGEREALARNSGVHLAHFDEIDYRDDLDEVLALLAACDLLITTSNASAHLAAALGKPVWLLYPGELPPFHYWAHGGDHRCLWYPSVEIVSAPDLADWPRLIARTAEKLQALCP